MTDPSDSFQLPSELRKLLPEAEQQTLRAEILEIHIRLLKRDRELEDRRREGYHLWLLFDAIAIRLQHQPNFKEGLVPNVIPDLIEHIRSDLAWYPHNAGDLRPCFLAPSIIQWRNAHLKLVDHDRANDEQTKNPSEDSPRNESHYAARKNSVRRHPKYEQIEAALRQIAKARPKDHKEVFRFLDDRKVSIPNRKPFSIAGAWLKGFSRNPHSASVWLSQVWRRLELPTFARGPKK